MAPSSVKVWLLAARPKTLWASVAPVIMGTALVWDDGGFHALSALCALLGAVLIQTGANYANDYFDFKKGVDAGNRLGPLRATQAGLVRPWMMMLATIAAFALALAPGAYLVYRGGIPILVIGILSITFGVLYTAGPFPLGYYGLGDLFVLVFFGPVAVGGTYYVQAREIDSLSIIAGLAPGLLSVAILTVNNLRDIQNDRRTGKRTLAVRFGKCFARLEYVASVLIASVIIPLYLVASHQAHWLAVSSCVVMVLAGPTFYTVLFKSDGPSLNKALAETGKLLLIFSVLFSIGWML